MPVEKGSKRVYFPAVAEAREALKERALALFEGYMSLAGQAAAAGDFETAEKIMRFLIEHMPNEGGKTLIDPSAAKPKELADNKPKGPTIQIGIALGGVANTKTLQPAVIDVTPDEHSN